MNANATIVPVAQLRTAIALAGRHSHLWTEVYSEHFENGELVGPVAIPSGGESLEVIAARSAPRAGVCGGIEVPELDTNGNIHHTTGTGRVEWTVAKDGSAVIRIHRPDVKNVLVASVTAHGEVSVSASTGYYYERHVEALSLCLYALHVESSLLLRGLMEKALDAR